MELLHLFDVGSDVGSDENPNPTTVPFAPLNMPDTITFVFVTVVMLIA